jgi:hypothetical protein
MFSEMVKVREFIIKLKNGDKNKWITVKKNKRLNH